MTRGQFAAVVHRLDVPPAQARILLTLERAEILDCHALGDRLGMAPSTLRVQIQNLRRRGWKISMRRLVGYHLPAESRARVKAALP